LSTTDIRPPLPFYAQIHTLSCKNSLVIWAQFHLMGLLLLSPLCSPISQYKYTTFPEDCTDLWNSTTVRYSESETTTMWSRGNYSERCYGLFSPFLFSFSNKADETVFAYSIHRQHSAPHPLLSPCPCLAALSKGIQVTLHRPATFYLTLHFQHLLCLPTASDPC